MIRDFKIQSNECPRRGKANNTYLYRHVYTCKHIQNTYTPISIQITLSI